MAVQHQIFVATDTVNNIHDQRWHTFRLEDLSFETLDLKFLNVVIDQLNRFLNEPIFEVLWVNHRSQIWNPNKVAQSSDEPTFPVGIDERQSFVFIKDFL